MLLNALLINYLLLLDTGNDGHESGSMPRAMLTVMVMKKTEFGLMHGDGETG